MRLDELAFVAVATPGKRGWKPTRAVTSATELDAVAGHDALDQLRRLVKLALHRWFFMGVLRREDLAELLEVRSKPVERHAEPAYTASTYLPVGRGYSAEEFVP